MTTICLSVFFIILSAVWWVLEYNTFNFPMEPLVVLIGGLTTLSAVYWPFHPSYSSKRINGRHTVDFTSNDGKFDIGEGDMNFTLDWTNADGSSIHIYRDPKNIKSIALADGCKSFEEIKNTQHFDFSSRAITPSEQEIVILINSHGNYALVQIHDIKSKPAGDKANEITFSYTINPEQKDNFS